MAKKVELIQEDQQLENRVYELGFHLVPTIGEDEVAVQFSHLKSLIEKRGGQFIAEEMPKFKNLAYPISKTVKAHKSNHLSSYFGWVKFEISPEEIIPLEKEIKAFGPMLRFLLIKTVKDNTFIGAVAEIKVDASKAVKIVDETIDDEVVDDIAEIADDTEGVANADEIINTEKEADIATE